MRAILATAALALAACQQDVASIRPITTAPNAQTAGVTQTVVPALCPPAGMTIRTSIGTEFVYLGRDPADPEVCRWNNARTQTISAGIHGLWSPAADTAQFHRAGLRQLVPFAVGKVSIYQSQSSTGAWRHTWRILAEETISVPAGRFNVWVIERVEEGVVGNTHRSEQIIYMDRVTGAVVKTLSRTVRGTGGPPPSWEAVTVRAS